MGLTMTEEMLTAILETIDEGIHVVDAKGITIFYNQVAAKLDGLSAQEVIGRPLLEVFPSLSEETSTLLKVIATGEPIYNQQQFYTNIKGDHLTTVNTTLPLRLNRAIMGAVEISKDITRVKELSEKLIDLQAQYRKQDKVKHTISSKQIHFQLHDIITQDLKMLQLKERAQRVARTSSPILVSGETGTGKELFVQGIHHLSPRKDGPFIAQNCAALPSTLLEGILFGTVRGSFTGAENRPGLFELAHEGTLFLDEINSMPVDLQAKLLRVLQEGAIRRIGGTELIPVNVRVIAAMNVPPEQALQSGSLRSDLYYRIKVVHLEVPPLRERKNDIPLLVEHFIRKFNFHFSMLVTKVEEKVMEGLLRHNWPGNVRELEHTIESAMNMVEDGTLRLEHFSEKITFNKNFDDTERETETSHSNLIHQKRFIEHLTASTNLRKILQSTEDYLIDEALAKTDGNIQQAANLLGIPRQTLQYKLQKRNAE